MKSFVPLIILFLAASLQAIFFKHPGFSGVFLNSVLVLLLYSVFFSKRYRATMIAAFLAGLLLDSLSGLPFGYLAFSMVAVVFLSFALQSFVLRDSFWHFIFFVVIGTALYDAALIAVLSLTRKLSLAPAGLYELGSALAIELALNIIAAFLFYPLRKWIIL